MAKRFEGSAGAELMLDGRRLPPSPTSRSPASQLTAGSSPPRRRACVTVWCCPRDLPPTTGRATATPACVALHGAIP